MEGYFLALGYSTVRRNIHKTGREIDIEALHRTEPRRVIAECKATERRSGGADLNKFAGVLDGERRRHPEPETVGYFLSLNGFAETGKEQEVDFGGRFIMVDGEAVAREMVSGRILVSEAAATERAGRCASHAGSDLKLDGSPDLLVDETGFIWVVYFARNKERVAYALVHADGEALALPVAQKVATADSGGSLEQLAYLPPESHGPSLASLQQARGEYLQYIHREYGTITLEGLPQDQDVGSRQLALEELFVPLLLHPFQEDVPADREAADEGRAANRWYEDEDEPYEENEEDDGAPAERIAVGTVLTPGARLALLGGPGSGKSTLLKRLATAYASPARRESGHDALPNHEWLPFVIRCRQLNGLARAPILDALHDIPRRAELPSLTNSFESVVDTSLRSGAALLLVDGLDEISSPADRLAFVEQLRTFLATYPAVTTVVTSRETGFRIVANALASVCDRYVLAEFSDEDINDLTVAWHVHVVGESAEVRSDARELANSIVTTDRVRRLARNPLLLTTLLLVKRWVGSLPRKRTVLYGKAIEVLLATWNVEGHDPIDQEETIPQLAFIAFSMMQRGAQTLSVRELEQLLHSAREQMPEVLGYARVAVPEFIHRVEDRSSVLSLSGHAEVAGEIVPLYEFKHLTFQEYLAAVGITRGFYPGRTGGDSLLAILEPHLLDPSWKEVTSLTAVLAAREAAPLVERLLEIANTRRDPQIGAISEVTQGKYWIDLQHVAELLRDCLVDEVQMPPDLVERVCSFLVRYRASRTFQFGAPVRGILQSRYNEPFRAASRTALSDETVWPDTVEIYAEIRFVDLGQSAHEALDGARSDQPILALVQSEDPLDRTAGAAITAMLTYANTYSRGRVWVDAPAVPADLESFYEAVLDPLADMQRAAEPHSRFASCWALAWMGDRGLIPDDRASEVMSLLIGTWAETRDATLARWAAWALQELPILPRDAVSVADPERAAERIVDESRLDAGGWDHDRRSGALVVAYYLNVPWSDQELAAKIAEHMTGPLHAQTQRRALHGVLESLGDAGGDARRRVAEFDEAQRVDDELDEYDLDED